MILKTEKETINFAKKITHKLKGGDILVLQGNLGAGKTTFVKGIAKELKIKKEITSPTFTIMNTYDIKKRSSDIKSLIHIDCYRLESEEELLEIGVEDYLGKPNTICVIEWPEKIKDLLKKFNTKKIKIKTINESDREIVLE